MMVKSVEEIRCPLARWIVASLCISVLAVADARAATGEEMARAHAPSVGQLAPDAVLDTVDGKRIELGDFYGRQPVYLKFWATWCVPCRQQMPHFEAAWQRYHDRVAVVAVNLGLNDDVGDVRDYLGRIHLSMPVAIDSAGDLAKAFGLVVTPLHVLIDADGRIAYVGHEASAELDRALEDLSRSTPKAKVASSSRPHVTAPAHAKVGEHAPAFSVQAAGRAWQFTPGKMGKPTVLAFITPWCESYLKDSRPEVSTACRQTREVLTQAYRAAPAQSAWIAVASRVWSTEADLPAYQQKLQVEYPVALDSSGEIFQHFGIRQVPTVVIVDAAGVIRNRFEGFSPELAGALAGLGGGAKKSAVLLTDPLPRLDGKEVVMLTVDVPPGGTSPPHRHNGYVYVYVLEGSMVMKTRDGPETTLVPGQHFVERPQDVHTISRNASASAPARFLAVMIKDVGAPITVAAD
jgi:quercetin dioxygenase-like cupin family protein/thiol-disulfide isomerase/thioredoxin